MNIKELKDKLIEAKKAYYNNEPIINDEEFDSLEDELRSIDPENEYFDLVGISSYGKTVKRIIPMKSAEKVKTFDEVKSWINKRINIEDEIIITPKYDGLSFECKYENGKPTLLSTRGDGFEGQDITDLIQYLPGLKPLKPVFKNFTIRGELIIKKEYDKNFENKALRNIVVGIIGRKNDYEDCKYVSTPMYEVLDIDFDTEYDKLDWIDEYFGNIIFYKEKNFDGIQSLIQQYENRWRNEFDYEIDGLIITLNKKEDRLKWLGNKEHHWEYNVAYKFKSITKETSYNSITLEISKHGYLIPVANFDEVNILNRKIKNATLTNYQRIYDMQLEIGDKILVSLSNDVIPYIEENLSKGIKQRNLNDNIKELKPETKENIYKYAHINNCPCCNSILISENLHLKCINSNCSGQIIKKITSWCKILGMENFSESTIEILYNNKIINKIIDLYSLDKEINNMLMLEGLGEKKIRNILTEIERTKVMTTSKFIDALNIPLVGEKTLKKYNIKSLQDIINLKNSEKVALNNLINFWKTNESWITDLLKVITVKEDEDIVCNGNKVCMTGKGHKTRDELIKDIISKGDLFIDSITKEVQILICEDVNGTSSKLEKARKLGIKLISYEEYFK
jgi:DNA ligase (NAD+)